MNIQTLEQSEQILQKTTEFWRSILKEQPYPLCVFPETTLPAATLWTGARVWQHRFREWNIASGSRVVILATHSAPMLQVLFGAWLAGMSIVLAPDEISSVQLVAETDAACCIYPKEWDSVAEMQESSNEVTFFSPQSPLTPEVRFLLQTSGTSSTRRLIALSDANIMSVVTSHQQAAPLIKGETVLSVLPWFHCFGLVLELLRSLFAGTILVRVPNGARNISALFALAKEYQPTVINMVPITAERLFSYREGAVLLQQIREGIIGGAPISATLAEKLSATNLRVGYGQTEAAPGIMLGEHGVWKEHYIGKPIGNEVKIDSDGIIHFRGENRALGEWSISEKRVHYFTEEWKDTGDIATGNNTEGYIFRGRKDHIFKLAHGIAIHPLATEAALRNKFMCKNVFIGTNNGLSLQIIIGGIPFSMPEEELQNTIASVIGVSKNIINRIMFIPNEEWKITAKGENDRRAFQQYLAEKG